MLHLERRKLALKGAYRPARFDLRLQLFHLALERPSLRVGLRHPQDFRQAQSSGLGRRLELAFAIVLLPLREHERMDVQRVSHVLRLDLRVIGQLDRLNLELKRIAMNLLRPNWCCHDTSSIVRSRCPLYRMRFHIGVRPAVMGRGAAACTRARELRARRAHPGGDGYGLQGDPFGARRAAGIPPQRKRRGDHHGVPGDAFACYMRLGRVSEIAGKAIRIASRTTSAAMNGSTPRNTVVVGTCGSSVESTNRFIPTGGLISPISTIVTTRMPNQTGSSPRLTISGKKTGRVSSTIDSSSIAVPSRT